MPQEDNFIQLEEVSAAGGQSPEQPAVVAPKTAPETIALEEVLPEAAPEKAGITYDSVTSKIKETVSTVKEVAGKLAPYKYVGEFVDDLLEPSAQEKRVTPGTKSILTPDEDDGFVERTGKTVGNLALNVTKDPLGVPVAVVKGLANGLVGMAAEGVAGATALYKAATGGSVREVVKTVDEIREGPEIVKAAIKDKLGVTPGAKTPVEKSLENTLGVLPDAIQSFSNYVYKSSEGQNEVARQALAGGAYAIGTFVTLFPGAALKGVRAVKGKLYKGKPVAEPLIAAAKEGEALLTEMTLKDPAKADELVASMKAVEPKLGEAVEGKVEELKQVKGEEATELGVKAVEEQLKLKEENIVVDAGKPKFKLKTKPVVETPPIEPTVIGEGLTKSIVEATVEAAKPEKVEPVRAEEPVLFRSDTGEAITEKKVIRNFEIYKSSVPVPGFDFVVGKLQAYWNEVIRAINPEALGIQAKVAAALTAKNIAIKMRKDVMAAYTSKGRREFWDRNEAKAREFIKRFETGKLQADAVLESAQRAYVMWNRTIYKAEQALGIKYTAVDNYLYHAFEDAGGVSRFFEQKYGRRWAEPGFVKDRSFEMYAQAEHAGFKPKYKNPEEIMLARQHASNVAEMRINTLKELERAGVASKITDSLPDPPPTWVDAQQWRSPNGDKYWVHENASAVLHNAFETQSLWNLKGMLGDTFRGAMFLKNILVPIQLSVSGFHAIHVLFMDNAAAMGRVTTEMMSGSKSGLKWFGEMLENSTFGSKGIPLKGLWDNPSFGGKLMKVYEGKLPPSALSAADRQAFQYLNEGGYIPHMSSQWKTTAMENFGKALRQRDASVTWRFPLAVMQSLSYPIMQVWIPRLKTASTIKDMQAAVKADPSLLNDHVRRAITFRKLVKSVDNRYGEMAYDTLFWNRTIKDLGVANALSLGWQLGFFREYGGAALDIKDLFTPKAQKRTFNVGGTQIDFNLPKFSLQKKIKAGMLNRPLFVAYYTTQALMFGGLVTYLVGGVMPDSLEDYLFPKVGGENPDGTAKRVNTQHYPKEFYSIGKRMQIDGVAGGAKHVIESKASGVIGLVTSWATGLNSMDQEVRDPDGDFQTQLQQSIAFTLQGLEPISTKAIRESDRSGKSVALGLAGMGPVAKYIKETVVQGKIKSAYLKYATNKQVPYQKFLLSNDRRELNRLYEANDMEGYDKKFDEVVEKFDLTAKEQMKLTKSIGNAGNSDASLTMFKSLPWQKQKALLDIMTEEERASYLPVANKDHLRFSYESPAEKTK